MKLKFDCFFFLLIFFFLNFTASGDSQFKTTIYEIQGGIVKMKEVNGLVINLSCEGSCIALEKSKVIINQAELNLNGGKNPGAVACRDVFKSSVVMLRGDMGEQSFCLFPDGSLLSTRSIIVR